MIEFGHQAGASECATPITNEDRGMNVKRAVKIIKNGKRDVVPKIPSHVGSAGGPNRLSTAVKSWVLEFKKHRRNNSVPSFDSLFK